MISTGDINLAGHGSYSVYTSFGIQRYCRFTVQGGKNSYRAHLVLFDASSGIVLTTSEAR